MIPRMFAMADMRGNLIAAAVLLVIGVLVLRAVRPKSVSRVPNRWLPVAALLCGPLSAIGWFLVDVFLLSPHSYMFFADYVEAIIPILTIGLLGGVLGGVVFWIADLWPLHRVLAPPPPTKDERQGPAAPDQLR